MTELINMEDVRARRFIEPVHFNPVLSTKRQFQRPLPGFQTNPLSERGWVHTAHYYTYSRVSKGLLIFPRLFVLT